MSFDSLLLTSTIFFLTYSMLFLCYQCLAYPEFLIRNFPEMFYLTFFVYFISPLLICFLIKFGFFYVPPVYYPFEILNCFFYNESID